ncbi:unnamed protein product [Eruca vesicaria subsp. sativa]|uniref:Uncharacterized protein n=1 Tax=Eruca vesicaria subsp. sativa TaxID=29727 RepID=A0ABC8LZN1_ERUVS|nr:unnamed protein product [Eruca vesicaria subsp. sativa]
MSPTVQSTWALYAAHLHLQPLPLTLSNRDVPAITKKLVKSLIPATGVVQGAEEVPSVTTYQTLPMSSMAAVWETMKLENQCWIASVGEKTQNALTGAGKI